MIDSYPVTAEHDPPGHSAVLDRGSRLRLLAETDDDLVLGTEQRAHAHLAAALEMEREAVEQLRELNAAKDEFVSTASHELRTPLACITAYAELLQDGGGLTPDQASQVAVIARNAARLSGLTEDLLRLAASDARREHLEPLGVDLRKVVAAAQEVVVTLAVGKNLVVDVELPDHEVLVAGDAGQLERVVLNLMSNAVKFTEPGGGVSCRLSGTPTEAFVAVVDSGIGIPLAEQGRLFESFFRGSEAHVRAIQGAGLGLHIAASIVSDHGGDISVDSVEGHGSTFTVRLPTLGVAE